MPTTIDRPIALRHPPPNLLLPEWVACGLKRIDQTPGSQKVLKSPGPHVDLWTTKPRHSHAILRHCKRRACLSAMVLLQHLLSSAWLLNGLLAPTTGTILKPLPRLIPSPLSRAPWPHLAPPSTHQPAAEASRSPVAKQYPFSSFRPEDTISCLYMLL